MDTARLISLATAAVMLAASACSKTKSTGGGEDWVREGEERTHSLRLDTNIVDIGTVNPEETVSASVGIKNDGTEPVDVESVGTDCECIGARVDDGTIAPGGSSRIRFELDTHASSGRQFHKISVTYGQGQTLELCVVADVTETY
ncbi:MAG: DUF1573 domain-containing protein [Marinilabiliaceae bacterium]